MVIRQPSITVSIRLSFKGTTGSADKCGLSAENIVFISLQVKWNTMRHKPQQTATCGDRSSISLALVIIERQASDHMEISHVAITSLCALYRIVGTARPFLSPPPIQGIFRFVCGFGVLTPQTSVIPPTGDRQCRSAASLVRSTPQPRSL